MIRIVQRLILAYGDKMGSCCKNVFSLIHYIGIYNSKMAVTKMITLFDTVNKGTLLDLSRNE